MSSLSPQGGGAVPALRQVQRRRLHELSQLRCVELVRWQCTVAHRACVQGLRPRIFVTMPRTLRHCSGARNAFGVFRHGPVLSPHLQAVRKVCRAWQVFAAYETLHRNVLVGGLRRSNSGPTSFDEQTCCTCRTSTRLCTALFYSGIEECGKWG